MPSGSDEPEASKVAARSAAPAVNDAVGLTFGARPPAAVQCYTTVAGDSTELYTAASSIRPR